MQISITGGNDEITESHREGLAVTDYIAEYITHLRRIGRADSTIKAYTDTLRRMDEDLDAGLLAALPEELESWLFDERWSLSTRKQRRATVTGFFAYMTNPKRSHRLDYNPALGLPPISVPKGRPRPLPADQLDDIMARAAQPFCRWYRIAAYAGARCVEISNLDREDINEDEATLRGKGGRTRVVPTHPAIWADVRNLPPGPIAVGAGGKRVGRNDICRRGNEHFVRLGHTGVTMHRLRHTFGTEAYEASGHDLRVVQELLGHASAATTQIYVAVSRAGMRRAVAGLYTAAAPGDAPTR